MTDLIECTFTGEAFIPRTPFMLRRAAERFGAGEIVYLNAEEERSMLSHRHYFATLNDLWANLPERFATEPWAQSPEHFRKWLLIRAGYSTAQTYACQSRAEAMRLAAAIRPLAEFNVVAVRDAAVIRFEAQSQSVKAMGKKAFQESKDAVLGAAEALVATGEIPEMAA
jgi:hypothetical protein